MKGTTFPQLAIHAIVYTLMLGIATLWPNAAAAQHDSFPPASKDWPMYDANFANQRYSALTQINKDNVDQLQVAWVFQTGYATEYTSFECTPIVVDGTMYVTSPKNDVYAIDPVTGDTKWHFDPMYAVDKLKLCCGIVNRGVAVSHGRVYDVTLDARIIALDAATGRRMPSFGKNGEIHVADDHTPGYSLTSPPAIWNGKIFIGIAGGEFRTKGYFSAYDEMTGELLWRWYTIPEPDAPNGDSWPNTKVRDVGGVTAWMPPALIPRIISSYSVPAILIPTTTAAPGPGITSTHVPLWPSTPTPAN